MQSDMPDSPARTLITFLKAIMKINVPENPVFQLRCPGLSSKLPLRGENLSDSVVCRFCSTFLNSADSLAEFLDSVRTTVPSFQSGKPGPREAGACDSERAVHRLDKMISVPYGVEPRRGWGVWGV